MTFGPRWSFVVGAALCIAGCSQHRRSYLLHISNLPGWEPLLYNVVVQPLSPVQLWQPGSPVHSIFQARILECVTISFSRGSSWPRGWTHVSCIGRWILHHWATREASLILNRVRVIIKPGPTLHIILSIMWNRVRYFLKSEQSSAALIPCWGRTCTVVVPNCPSWEQTSPVLSGHPVLGQPAVS